MKIYLTKSLATILLFPTLAFSNPTTDSNGLPSQLYGRVVITQNGEPIYGNDFTLEDEKAVNLSFQTPKVIKDAQKLKERNSKFVENINTGFTVLKEKNMFNVSYTYLGDVNSFPNTYGIQSTKQLKSFQCHTDELSGSGEKNKTVGIRKDITVVYYAFCQNKDDLPSEEALLKNPKPGAKNTPNTTTEHTGIVKSTKT